jgi:hypothetical protein
MKMSRITLTITTQKYRYNVICNDTRISKSFSARTNTKTEDNSWGTGIGKVGATGLCHSDLHLVNGDWKKNIHLQLPKIPGHEIAGGIEEIGDSGPK